MKHHTMKLKPSPFEKIKSGRKTVELRLYDEKRQRISVGDTIRFVNTECESDCVTVVVERLHLFDSFEQLYCTLPLTKCGYSEQEMSTASPNDMEQYYSAEEQSRYGVVGIEIALQK